MLQTAFPLQTGGNTLLFRTSLKKLKGQVKRNYNLPWKTENNHKIRPLAYTLWDCRFHSKSCGKRGQPLSHTVTKCTFSLSVVRLPSSGSGNKLWVIRGLVVDRRARLSLTASQLGSSTSRNQWKERSLTQPHPPLAMVLTSKDLVVSGTLHVLWTR